MKRHIRVQDVTMMEDLMSVCCGNPQGDELPQVAGLEDIMIDVVSDALQVPHQYAAGAIHHQFDNDFADYNGMIH